MKLITVEAKIVSDSIRKSIDVFNSQASTVRGMYGCESYAIYEAPSGDDSILIFFISKSHLTFSSLSQVKERYLGSDLSLDSMSKSVQVTFKKPGPSGLSTKPAPQW